MKFIKQPINIVSHNDLKSRLSKCQYDSLSGSWAEVIPFFIAYPHQIPYHCFLFFKHPAVWAFSALAAWAAWRARIGVRDSDATL